MAAAACSIEVCGSHVKLCGFLCSQDFDPKKRVTGIPGYNLFGAPGSKLKDSGIPFIDFFQ